jgi:hypothetical protein
VPWTAEDTIDTIREKFRAKQQSMLGAVGPFEFRKGPYGVYMFKKDISANMRKFVTVPAGVNVKTLTPAAATALYQAGLQQKAKAKAYGYKKNE